MLSLALCWANGALADGLLRNTPAPVPGEPVRCFSPGDDVYCWMQDNTIRALSDGRTVFVPRADPGYGLGAAVCAADKGGAAGCLFTEVLTQGQGQSARTHLQLVIERNDGTRARVHEGYVQDGIGMYPIAIDIRDSSSWIAYGQFNKKETTHIIANRSGGFPVHMPSGTFGERLSAATGKRLHSVLEFFRVQGRLWAAAREGTDLVVSPVGPGMTWRRIAGPSMYDMRVVEAADGWVYIFSHDSDADTAKAVASEDGITWREVVLDKPESGWQLDAAPAGYGVVSVWYYLRNTYNKGVRVAFLRGGTLVQPPHTLVRSEEHNTGWLPHLGIDKRGRTYVTWLDDVLSEDRAWTTLSSPLDLAEVRLNALGDFEEARKFWSLQAGSGGWYTLWNTFEMKPDKEKTGGVAVGQVDRRLANTVLFAGLLEARLYKVQLALGYAQSVVDAASESLNTSYSQFLGSLKLERLIAGHDIQVRSMIGRYHGRAIPGSNGDADGIGAMRIDTPYTHGEALALNKWRVKYGLSYARYALPSTVNVYGAPAGQTVYRYVGSFLRNVTYDHVRLLLGYSKLDYLARYENRYSGVLADADVLLGVSRMHFDDIRTTGLPKVESGWALAVGAHVDLGWLWMRRLRALAGLGVYVRPTMRMELDWTLGGAPGDRSGDAAKTADSEAGISLVSLRYGPWCDVGLVW
jgi:hypothetical protein